MERLVRMASQGKSQFFVDASLSNPREIGHKVVYGVRLRVQGSESWVVELWQKFAHLARPGMNEAEAGMGKTRITAKLFSGAFSNNKTRSAPP
jgi:hypothetical protein